MNFKKKVNGSWTDTPHYIHKTSTDTITTLPADIYPNDTTATVGLKGNMSQTGTPTPDSPVMPEGCGDMTGNLFDKSTWNGVSAQRGTIEAVTNGFKLTATGDDCYSQTYTSFAPSCSYAVTSGKTYTLSWDIDNLNIYGIVFVFSGVSAASSTLTSVTASSKKVTFTIPSGHKYVAFRIGVAYSGDSLTYTNIMLNEGSTALPYEPYGYKIPISSASTTTPVYLGEVETTRKIYKYELTGQETSWRTTAGFFYNDSIQPDYIRIFDTNILMCSHYKAQRSVGQGSEVNDKSCAFYRFVSVQRLYFKDSSFSTLTDFTTYLQQQYSNGTPVTIWYVLAEPTTGIVNEPLRKIGDYADTVSGITIPTITGKDTFDVETSLKPSEVSLSYTGWHDATVKEWDGSQWG